MIWAISWRNVWRNKLRSTVIVASIAVGIFAGVFTWAFYAGMVNQRIQTAITTEASHLQIHHKNFLENPDQKYHMTETEKMLTQIETLPEVKSASRRLIVDAMATSAETGSGVNLIGIDPEKERQVTNLSTKIIEGTYFEGIKKNQVVIGEELAEKLSLKLRSRIVLTLQNAEGTLTTDLFRVEGIYRTSNTMYDEVNVFVQYDDVANIIGLEDAAAHEMAVLLQDNEQLLQVKEALQNRYPELDVSTWKELKPDVSLIEETMNFTMYIFMGIILVALVFGIINTMLMAVLERVKELGMLMAVGMNKTRVFIMIVLETLFLSIQGGITGIIIGYVVTLLLSKKGIDLANWAAGFEKMGYETVVYPIANVEIAVQVAAMVLVAGLVASVFPAVKALRLRPAEALHIDI